MLIGAVFSWSTLSDVRTPKRLDHSRTGKAVPLGAEPCLFNEPTTQRLNQEEQDSTGIEQYLSTRE
jgi:hypothetical protein